MKLEELRVDRVADAVAAEAVDGIGRSPLRKEDGPLLLGTGSYIADFKRPGMLHALVVRSPHAHARILGIDKSAALAQPGVAAVITAADLPGQGPVIPMRQFRSEHAERYLQRPLAVDVARYSGEPVAVVVADSRYRAEDAAESLQVEYEVLPAVLDPEAAVRDGTELLHPGAGTNAAGDFEVGKGDLEAAFRAADRVFEAVLRIQRHAAVPLETRGLLAEFDPQSGVLTVWGAAKIPHVNRGILARLLGWPDETRIRLVELHVGGGFGARGEFYPEDYLIPYCALTLGRPIAWVEDREENLRATNHSREQVHHVRMAVRSDGTFLALHDRLHNNQGAYIRTHGMTVPAMSAAMLPGPYFWPAYKCEVKSVVTNKTPAGTYRSPGRYEANFVRERMVDLVAHELGRDPVELRRQNLILAGSFPYSVGTHYDGHPVIYDSGDYELLLDKSLEYFDYAGLRRWRQQEPPAGMRRGVGVGYFVEKAGPAVREYARLEITEAGEAVVFSGSASVGQGVETIFAQICASHLGLGYDRITVKHGDTAVIPEGMGAFGSRAAMLGGAAVTIAADQLRERVVELAAEELGVPAAGVAIAPDGTILSAGAATRLTLAEVRQLAGGSLTQEARFVCDLLGFPYGLHLAGVEVDLNTGHVRIDRYAVGYDIGRCINPMLVRGQITGGAAQGIGGALLEEFSYDAGGQPLSASFMDYLMPTAVEVPELEILVTEDAPSPLNPLGVKGAGEGGTAAVGATIANGVADALGVEVFELPVTPARVLQLARSVQ